MHYFINGCRDDTLVKHKLMRWEPSTLVQLVAVIDKYAVAESSMKLPVLVDASGKSNMPTPVVAPAAARSQADKGKCKDN
ncbi:Endoglucanase 3 [Hordeum vulgare]|nr:Endoglucanase 3 [Hordeum vulgare]